MAKRKWFMWICIIIMVVVALFLIEYLSVNSLTKYVEAALRGEISKDETEGKPVNRYNIADRQPIATADVSVRKVFTIHDFNNGYLWVHYSCIARDSEGRLLYCSIAYSRWKIHKENGKWEIIEIVEAP